MAARKKMPRSVPRSSVRSTARSTGRRARGSSAQVTTDHQKIRDWIEERGGIPSSVIGTMRGGRAGLLRVDYPGFSGEGRLKPVDWDEFFDKFEDQNLAFIYQDKTASGRVSRFSKFVDRQTAAQKIPASRRKRA